jgi:uncharacterized protein YceK
MIRSSKRRLAYDQERTTIDWRNDDCDGVIRDHLFGGCGGVAVRSFIALFVILLPACNSIKKITEGAESTPPAPYATSVQGTLQGQYECVSLNGLDPALPIEVLLNGNLVATSDYNRLGYNICFRNHVVAMPDGTFLITGPVSNAGDRYRITTEVQP